MSADSPNTILAARAADHVAQRDYAIAAAPVAHWLERDDDNVPVDLSAQHVVAYRRAWMAWQELCRVRWAGA